MSSLTKEKLAAELMKKLQVVRLDLMEKGYSRVSREFFWVSIPAGSINGHDTYKEIDLAREFSKDLEAFAKNHNVKLYSTKEGWLFN